MQQSVLCCNTGTFLPNFTQSHLRRQFCVLWNISSCKWLSWVHQSVWCFEWVAACEGAEGLSGPASSNVVQTCEPCRSSCSCTTHSWAGELLFLQWLVSGLHSFGMWCCILQQVGMSILAEPAPFIIRVGEWSYKRYGLPKCWFLSLKQHDTPEKTIIMGQVVQWKRVELY